MVQFSKNSVKNNNKKTMKELTKLVTLYIFFKDQTSHYINICISSSKTVFYKISISTAYLSSTHIYISHVKMGYNIYIYYIYYIYIYIHRCITIN